MADGKKRLRVLWLHTQPEHYFNCMMDDLAGGTGYRVGEAGLGGGENTNEIEWVAAFSYRGPGWYTENAQPRVAETIFLRVETGKEERGPAMGERYHVDWLSDLRDLDFDVVIVSGYGSRTHREVIGECHRRGIPVAMWSDSNWRSQDAAGVKAGLRRAAKKWWLRGIVKSVDVQLTANSMGVKYWEEFGAKRENPGGIVVCPCYSDYRRVDAARKSDRGEVLTRIGLAARDRFIFTAARLVDYKGIDLMIEVMKRGTLNEWRYVVAGIGPDEARLNGLAGELLGKRIFFPGFQQPSDNLALMAHADIFVLPSRSEPHGIVVGESMAAGTPVVTSDVVGAAADLIEDGVNGRIFIGGSAVDLERALGEVLMEGQLEPMRGAARAGFEKWYGETSPMVVVPRVVRSMARGNSSDK